MASHLDADTPVTTPSGATFTAPKGWKLTVEAGFVLLEAPDRAMRLAFVERKDPSAREAVAAAWKRLDPGFTTRVKLDQSPPARGGWDEVANVDYEMAAIEPRHVRARARRKGDTWYVALFDGTREAASKRWAQTNLAFASFRAPGVVEESFRGRTARALDGARLRALEEFVEQGRAAMQIPGAALAVVQAGKVVLAKGFGVRELGAKDPVLPSTPFRIASMTKPLTSLFLATLVDEGKLSWDAPVSQLLPAFSLGDPEVTRQITVKHTMCACTGMPRRDSITIFEHAGTTPDALFARLSTAKPTTGLGETFQYSNDLVAAGGYVGAHAFDPQKPLGPAYEAAMQAKVFGPLGMKSTTFRDDIAKRARSASPHNTTAKLEVVHIPASDDDFVKPYWLPTGGAWSTVEDLARYLLVELGGGATPEGERVISAQNLEKRREVQVRTSDRSGYGLGLVVDDDRGVRVAWHNGNLRGYSSNMFFLPEHGVGAVLLTNMSATFALHAAVRRKLLELLFDGRDEAREDYAFQIASRAEEHRVEAATIDFAPGRAWLERFAGSYANPALGRVTLRIEGDRGVFDVGEWKSTVGRATRDDGTEEIVLTSASWKGTKFVPREVNGKLVLTFEEGQERYELERIGPALPREAAIAR